MEGANGWRDKYSSIFPLGECCTQISGHTVMAHGIRSVGGKSYFKYFIRYDFKNFFAGFACLVVVFEDHNAVVALAKTQFVFSTNHTLTQLTSDFTFLDYKGFPIFGIKRCAYCGYRNRLACSNIGCPTYNLYMFCFAYINLGNVKPIGIGMFFASQYLANNNSF